MPKSRELVIGLELAAWNPSLGTTGETRKSKEGMLTADA